MGLVVRVMAELAGRGNGWTDLSAHLADEPIRLHYGINGTGPSDRVASTGTFNWAFVNHASTKPFRPLGYFSPNHPNRLPGWKLGAGIQLTLTPEGLLRGIASASWDGVYTSITTVSPHTYFTGDSVVLTASTGTVLGTYAVEVTGLHTFRVAANVATAATAQRKNTYYKFVGSLDAIQVSPGFYSGDFLVRCTAVDWMNDAARQKVGGLATLTNIKSEEAFAALVAAASVQPRALEIQEGQDTYQYAFDNSRDEKISLISEFQRLASSELGYIYIKGDRAQGGTLVFETRRTRALSTTNLDSFLDATTNGQGLQRIEMDHSRAALVNKIQVTTHPRRVDATNTTVLSRLETPTPIGAGSSITLLFPYRDPTQEAARVGGIDMIPPVAYTDYAANTAADGSGSDLTWAIAITANFGGNGVRFTLTNESTTNAYITLLQSRGRGLYDFQNVILEAEDEASIGDNGEQIAAVDMVYQSDPAVAYEAALYLVNLYKDPASHVRSATLFCPYSDPSFADRLLRREISDRIGITERVTGLAPGARGLGYFINSVDIVVDARSNMSVSWGLAPADRMAYWQLEIPTRSELDQTTVLGYAQIIGHTDVAHCDTHADTAHADTAHADTAHADTAHGDSAHLDVAHGDTAHGDTNHGDVAHADTTHSDVAHTDQHDDQAHVDFSHQDQAHEDTPHVDDSHGDTPHDDGGHQDVSHEDEPHLDAHGDYHEDGVHNDGSVSHVDVHDDGHYDSHSDVSHEDTAHGDTSHVDDAHGDSLHNDVEHADSHTDVLHGDGHSDSAHLDVAHADTAHADTAHSDSHTDTAHQDGGHDDVGHSDTAHTDTAHSDVTHIDDHCDVSHGDL